MNNPVRYYTEIGQRYISNACVEDNVDRRRTQVQGAIEAFKHLGRCDANPAVADTAEMLFELRRCAADPVVSKARVGIVMDRLGIGTREYNALVNAR